MTAPYDSKNRKSFAHKLVEDNRVVVQHRASQGHAPNAAAWYSDDGVRPEHYVLVLPSKLPSQAGLTSETWLMNVVRTYGADNEKLLSRLRPGDKFVKASATHYAAVMGCGVIYFSPRVAVVEIVPWRR